MLKYLKKIVKYYVSNSKVSPFLNRRADSILKWVYKLKRANFYYQEISGSKNVTNQSAMEYNYFNRNKLYEFVIEEERLANKSIDYLEFGVYKGDSLKWWLKNINNPESRFFAFDTFQGLPEDWGTKCKGTFSTTGKLPLVNDERCNFEVGLFQDTLHKFLERVTLDRQMIVHLDADLYSSTLFILTTLSSKLKKGDMLLFDEFMVEMHEFRAFCDFISTYKLDYKILGFVNGGDQIAFKVT